MRYGLLADTGGRHEEFIDELRALGHRVVELEAGVGLVAVDGWTATLDAWSGLDSHDTELWFDTGDDDDERLWSVVFGLISGLGCAFPVWLIGDPQDQPAA